MFSGDYQNDLDLDASPSPFSDLSGSVTLNSSFGGLDDADLLSISFGQSESGTATTDFEFNPVDHLWFSNTDNIVLQAEGHFFRVPPALFISKSSIFKAAYYNSNTSSSPFFKKKYEGTDPAIIEKLGGQHTIIFKMLDVTVGEAAVFLCALFDPEYFEFNPPQRENLEVILAIFKLASIYEVIFLRRRALAHLERAYPCSDISDWDSREERSTFSLDRLEFHQAVSETLTTTLTLIELCTVHDAPWILPTAFYECCLYDIRTLLGHPKWTEVGNADCLSSTIKNKIICGYFAHKEETSRVLIFLHASLPPCKTTKECIKIRRDELQKICTARDQSRDMQDFLGRVWDAADWDEFGSQGMCDNCMSTCQSLYNEFRITAWNGLPGLYELPNWNELREQRSVLMPF